MHKKGLILSGFVVLGLMASACSAINPAPGMSEATAHVMTLYAVLTESSQNLNQPTAAATLTQAPTVQPTALPTATLNQLPSVTPGTPLSTNQPIPCLRADFVKDVTIPDGYKLAPGVTFTKTWELINNGSCDWAANTKLVFVSGEQMGGPATQDLGEVVVSGDTVDISVTLTAPATSGTHTGYWALRSPGGVQFGLGTAGNESFWVQIVILSGTPSGTVTITSTSTTPQLTKTPTLTATPTRTNTPVISPTPTNTATCVGGYPVC